jgi:hypothetical protein
MPTFVARMRAFLPVGSIEKPPAPMDDGAVFLKRWTPSGQLPEEPLERKE